MSSLSRFEIERLPSIKGKILKETFGNVFYRYNNKKNAILESECIGDTTVTKRWLDTFCISTTGKFELNTKIGQHELFVIPLKHFMQYLIMAYSISLISIDDDEDVWFYHGDTELFAMHKYSVIKTLSLREFLNSDDPKIIDALNQFAKTDQYMFDVIKQRCDEFDEFDVVE